MKYYSIVLLLTLFGKYAYSQKGIEKLSFHKIDSLQQIHVDTILWYHSYCGECFVIKKDKPAIYFANCSVQSGYTLTYNAFLYKQNGKYFILKFNCDDLAIKEQLDSCQSIPYFISIIPTLIARNRVLKAMSKRGEFLGPSQMDGGFEDADVYLNNKAYHISMSDTEETDVHFKKYFWIEKQIKLLKLISNNIP